jgi:hypothetical protein
MSHSVEFRFLPTWEFSGAQQEGIPQSLIELVHSSPASLGIHKDAERIMPTLEIDSGTSEQG